MFEGPDLEAEERGTCGEEGGDIRRTEQAQPQARGAQRPQQANKQANKQTARQTGDQTFLSPFSKF